MSTSSKSESILGKGAISPDQLVRKAETFEVLEHVYHDLGIMSNVVVAAQYTHHAGSGGLTRPKLFRALKRVVKQHVALSTIGVTQPSEKKKGNHRLWEMHLPHIDLDDCVEFIESDGELSSELPHLLERVHNQWFDTQDLTKPWWSLLVVNKSYVIFVYHHSIADGLSGFTFHRSLAAALNHPEEGHEERTTDEDSIAITSDNAPQPYPRSQFDDKVTLFWVIVDFLYRWFLRTFLSKKSFFFHDAVFSPELPSIDKPFPPEKRSVTSIQIHRIDSPTMEKTVAECRKHNTSFTALLHTLVQMTLAVDSYPSAKVGLCFQVCSVRRMMNKNPGLDVFLNASSSHFTCHRLGKYRQAARDLANGSNDEPSTDAKPSPNPALLWELARVYKNDLTKAIDGREPLSGYLQASSMGQDDEDLVSLLSALAYYQNRVFSISNLGVFRSGPEGKTDAPGDWQINDICFSAAATWASIGFPLVLNVASTEQGGCVIAASYNKGVLKDDMVKQLLTLVGERLQLLLQ